MVGAEGRGSVVRREAGIGATGLDYRQNGVVATVRLERPHEGVAYEYFLPAGPFAILPLTDQRASLVWTERNRRRRRAARCAPEAFRSLLQRRFGDFLGRVEVEGPVFVYPLCAAAGRAADRAARRPAWATPPTASTRSPARG